MVAAIRPRRRNCRPFRWREAGGDGRQLAKLHSGRTALAWATRGGNPEIIAALVKAGAAANDKDNLERAMALSRLRGYELDRELETKNALAFKPGQSTGRHAADALSGPFRVSREPLQRD